tara:strand:- start:5050 stop:6861 length:1812 start_codon:yes stop_codon:yes gene_type:complete
MRKITLLMVGFILSTIYASAQWPVNTQNSAMIVTADMEKDAAGNVYVLGTFEYKTTFANGFTAVASSYSTTLSFFVIKYDPSGNVAWTAYPAAGSNFAMKAIDMEIENGQVYIVSAYDPGSGTPIMRLLSYDAGGAFIGSAASAPFLVTGENYYVSSIDLAGNPLFISQVDAIPGVSIASFKSIQPIPGTDDVFLGGSAVSGGMQDAFISEYAAGSPYSGTGNQSAITSNSSLNVINDLELIYSSSTGADVLFGIGTMGDSGPIGTSLPFVSSLSDYFVASFEPFGPGLGATLADFQGKATDFAYGNALDGFNSGTTRLFTTGQFSDDLPTHGLPSGGVANAFMAALGYDHSIPAFYFGWAFTVDPGAIASAVGNDVVVDDGGDVAHFVGDFDGDQFEVMGNPAPNGPMPGVMGAPNSWQTAIEVGSAACAYNASILNAPGASTCTLVGVAVDYTGNVYATGDYVEELEAFNTSTATYAPIVHPNPGVRENFSTRFDFLAGSTLEYYKQSTTNSVALTDDENTQLNVYPNPAKDRVQVALESNTEEMWNVKIYNTLGALIYTSSELSSEQSLLDIDLNEMPAGVYLLRVEQNDFVYTQQLVVQ